MLDLSGDDSNIMVLTSRQSYDTPNVSLPRREQISGIDIHRVWSTHFGRAALLGRTLDYLSFYISVCLHLHRIARSGDVVVVMTDPPLMSIPVALVLRRRNVRIINWLQDLFPEVAIVLDVRFVKGWAGRWLQRARDWSLNAADRVVVLGDLMKERVEAAGIDGSRIAIIPNWADDNALEPVPPGQNELRDRWGLNGKLVIGYSGNLGRAHEFHTLLGAANRLRGRDELAFLFIGGGYLKSDLRGTVVQGLDERFQFQPYQDRAVLSQSLSAADIHWISLRPELEGMIVPSKFYGIAAVARPIIFVGDPDGELARIIRQYECGLVVSSGDFQGMAEAITRLADDPEWRRSLGNNARAMVEAEFSKARSLEKWRALLHEVASGT